MNGPTRASQQSGGSVQDHMINFMDPAPRERHHAQIELHHTKNGITHLYALQLQEANKTIENLRAKKNQSHAEIALKMATLHPLRVSSIRWRVSSEARGYLPGDVDADADV
ncbi:hypothetical protein PCASD_05308 [Puccinia coronata f. sp. avenae]|uniref:Uncharacterized protein n=1 Tax=Puccinia coronata f. sp. avenae TaxID=200324 RepID=A0A2N5UXV0_9BASI|nr:hypothetical protein PCASD_05308 [Puccinia coronata f. sp. avenae]